MRNPKAGLAAAGVVVVVAGIGAAVGMSTHSHSSTKAVAAAQTAAGVTASAPALPSAVQTAAGVTASAPALPSASPTSLAPVTLPPDKAQQSAAAAAARASYAVEASLNPQPIPPPITAIPGVVQPTGIASAGPMNGSLGLQDNATEWTGYVAGHLIKVFAGANVTTNEGVVVVIADWPKGKTTQLTLPTGTGLMRISAASGASLTLNDAAGHVFHLNAGSPPATLSAS